jgi:hypothetical protein
MVFLNRIIMKKFILFYRENAQKLSCSLEYAAGVLRGLGLNSSLQGINFSKKGIYYVAFLLLFFSQSTLHSQIIIDGDPSDWPAVLNNPANTKKAFKHDPFDVLHVDDQWTGGSSDTGANPSTHWFWANGNSNDKGDIANAGAVLLGTKLYFFGDRTAANGNAQIGFWFFKDDVRPTGDGSSSSPFTGEHVNGDILIISNFVNGGGNAQPSIYMWAGKTDVNPGALVLVTGGGLDAALVTNSSVVDVPTGQMFNGEMWTFYPKFGETGTYPNPLFFEGYLDLATLPGEYNACFQRFLLETRNSQSINASLQDLVAGQFYGVPAAPTAISNAFCGTGSVSLSASGCNGTLKWYTSASGGVAIGEGSPFNTPEISETTTYYVSCTVDGCEGPRTAVTATINPSPSGVGVPTHVTCYGAATGSIDLTPSGGTPPYTYAWTKVGDANFAASTQDVSDLTAGVYSVVITDSKGCVENVQVEIVEAPLVTPEISKNPGNASTLCGVSPSEAQALIDTAFTNWLNEAGAGYENGVHVDNPGTAPYSITMSPENPSAPLYSGGSVDVTWTITDACGLTDTVIGTFTVDNNCRIICETVPTDVLCNDGSTGSIAVTASAGFPPYNFYLYLSSDLNTQLDSVLDVDSNPGMATFLNLPAGTYTVLITDAVQDLEDPTLCSDTSISQPELPLASQISNVDVLCYGDATGSIDLSPSGGTPPYTFSWSASNGGVIPEGQENNEDLTGLVAGTYSVVIIDANGNEGGCRNENSAEIMQSDELTCSIEKNSDEICIGGLNGSATVSVLGGSGDYTYLWDNGETTATATGLSSGLHSVTITDSNGCVTSCEITIATIPCDDAHCTYTQGFYGNYGGLGCTPDYGTVNSHVMMTNALTQVGGSFNFGSLNTGNYFLLKLSDVTGAGNPAQNKIYKMLPGGGSPRALVGYATYDEYATWSDNDPLVAKGANKGKINNNLLSQTITLFFNLQMDQSLGGVVLESSFATAKTITCGSNEPNMETAQEFTISSNVISYLENNGGATVANLFALANKSLGGESTGGINAATINNAVDAINRGFDECRVKVVIPEETIETRSIAFDDKDVISNSRPISGNVTIYPVPFQDSFTVNYGLDYDSLIKVQIFDIKGALIYQLNDIDTKQNHEIRVEPTFNKGKGEMYIVKVITDREVIIKKVISSQY